MGEPIVLISHLRIKKGKLGELRLLSQAVVKQILDEKPLTLAFLSYISGDGSLLTIVHVFGDADSTDAHFEGSDERSRAAFELLEPAGWEMYGRPSEQALGTMVRSAEEAGVQLTLAPEYSAGFLRLGTAARQTGS